MGIFQRLFGRNDIETREAPTTSPTSPQFLDANVGQVWGGGYSDTGVNVDELTALAASAVWACVQIISQTVATLPLHVQSREGGKRLYDHPLYDLLANEPNDMMTSAAFRESQMANLLLWGNAYSYIQKDEYRRPIALLPLQSAVTRPTRINGELAYITRVGGTQHTLRADEVTHVAGMTLDGITGLSPIQFARQNVGLSIGLERYAAKFFSNGGNVGGVLSLPPMSPDAITNFAAQWRANHTGVENALKIAVLPDGYKFTPTTTNPENAQALQARVHQIREAARIYRVPPHMLGDTERASYASLEIQDTAFHSGTIAPYVTKFEAEYDRKLLLDVEKKSIQSRFNMDASLRATTQQRYDAHAKGIGAGFLTINEARAKENLPPVKGGDELLRPLNLGPVAANATRAKAGLDPLPDPAASQANRQLVEDTAGRVLTKETRAIQRAAKKHAGKPDEFRSWADEFYLTHTQHVANVFGPLLKAIGSKTTAEEYAQRHCADSLAAIDGAITSKTPFDDLIDDINERKHTIADELN